MNPTPKTLQVFLPEGTPAGIQIAELTTRIVQAVSVPRTHLKQGTAWGQSTQSNNKGRMGSKKLNGALPLRWKA